MLKKRTPPGNLVSSVKEKTTKGDWYRKLSGADRCYVIDVRDALAKRPDVPVYVVARKLAKELSLNVSATTIARKLKEMIADAKTSP